MEFEWLKFLSDLIMFLLQLFFFMYLYFIDGMKECFP